MATIVITIPDAVDSRVADAVCARHGWTAAAGTKKQFVKQYLIDILKDDVRWFEAQTAKESHRVAGNTAEQSALASVEAEILLT